MVYLVNGHKCFSQEDYEGILTHALDDPLSALIYFITLARQAVPYYTKYAKEYDPFRLLALIKRHGQETH